jgi:uncharacterized protein DUF4845
MSISDRTAAVEAERVAGSGVTASMHGNRHQRGVGSLSGIVSLVVLGCVIFLGIKLGPAYLSNYQLQDSISNLALIATYSPMSEEEIRRSVISRANTYGIDLEPKQVTVHKAAGTVVIVATYTVPVDLVVRRVEIQFEPSTSNRNITLK